MQEIGEMRRQRGVVNNDELYSCITNNNVKQRNLTLHLRFRPLN